MHCPLAGIDRALISVLSGWRTSPDYAAFLSFLRLGKSNRPGQKTLLHCAALGITGPYGVGRLVQRSFH